MCVGTRSVLSVRALATKFQCRTRHYVCRDARSTAASLLVMPVSMPHAALCVSGPHCFRSDSFLVRCFNAARGIMCVGTLRRNFACRVVTLFQCRTRHYVCRDVVITIGTFVAIPVSMPHAALCVSGPASTTATGSSNGFNAARGIMCVGTNSSVMLTGVTLCFNAARGITCVGTQNFGSTLEALTCFNAARSIMCVGTI